MIITQQHINKLNSVIDAGLCYGIGTQEPGKMCVEAAVCYALDLPHSDDPPCVSRAIRAVKIRLNDSNWSSNSARAKGLRKLAIAQLGSAGAIDDIAFSKRLAELTIRRVLPRVLRKVGLETEAKRCEEEGSAESALAAAGAAGAAGAAADAAADAAARAAGAAGAAADAAADAELSFFADLVLEILTEMNAPGIKWLQAI